MLYTARWNGIAVTYPATCLFAAVLEAAGRMRAVVGRMVDLNDIDIAEGV